MKILVIQQKMIGDVLTTSILCKQIKLAYKDSEIHYLINTNTYPVVKNNPYIDQFIYFTSEEEESRIKFYKFLKNIKKTNYDVVIDVYNKLSSQFVVAFSGAKTKIGYHKKYTSALYTHSIQRNIKPSKNVSLAIENRMKLLKPLQIDFKSCTPKIYLKEDEINQARMLLKSFSIDSSKQLFMISVLGSNPKKTYPANYMAALLDYLVSEKKDAQILFNYIPNQLQEAKEIFSLCLQRTQKQIYFDLFGKNLREFLALTYHCNALIGNEGGAVNMAKALQIPTFIIFNPALNKANWFGDSENTKNSAVHLSDFIPFNKMDKEKAKKNSNSYYLKFKPTFITPKLGKFLNNL